VWKLRYGNIAFYAVLFLLVSASAYLSPALQNVLASYYSTEHTIEGLRGLILNAGTALIGAAAIVTSLVLFAMQVNIERMPHGLFRRLSADRKLLGAFASVAPAGWPVSAIEEMRGRVREGGSLAATIAETFPSAPRHIVSILGAGEGSGAISEACRLAAHELELVATTSRAVRSALAYPALLALAGTVAVGVLVGIVLPRFAALLSDIGQALPWST